MGHQQGGQAEHVLRQGPAQVLVGPGNAILDHHEQQHERNAGDDLGVDHGHIADVVDDRLAALAHGVDSDGRSSAHHGGDHRGDEGHHKAQAQGAQDHFVVEQALIPLEGEACKDGAAFALVEAEHRHHGDGHIHEGEQQNEIHPLQSAKMRLFHYMTPSTPSLLPLVLVRLMHKSTMTISTRLMALPRL